MKRIVMMTAAALCVAGCANTQQGQGYAQNAPMDYQAASVDAQIEAVRANYEDVKAQAQAQIDARAQAEAAAARKKAQQQAAAAKKKAQQQAEAARIRAEKQAKIDKRNDEKAELELEMMRLDVQRKKAQVGADSAINNAIAERAKDLVDTKVEEGRAQVEKIRAK